MTETEKINILLVDDKPENLLALEAIIEQEDYHLVKAHSGEEALKSLLKYDFAAILLDVQMPGIDGFETARIIKAREKTKTIPILFITANNMESQHIFMGYSLGAIDYIVKPFDPIILKAKVDGFVKLYRLNQALIQQAQQLSEKKKELEDANIELSNITKELRVSEEIANVISDTSLDSMMILDHTGTVLKVNPASKTMFGYDNNDIVGNNIFLLFTNEASRQYIQVAFHSIQNLGTSTGFENLKEIIATRKNGETFPAEIQIGKRFVQGKCIVAITIRDITTKKQSEELIAYMAYHDGLTQLPNRRLLIDKANECLNQAKQTNQPFSIMYLDLDRFKYINDSLGHFIGDKVLCEVANRLQQAARQKDIVARIGGDEFIIILPETNRETALELAEVMMDRIKTPFFIENYELYVSICIGISVFPYDGEELIALMKKADAALCRAKEQGGNMYKVFHSGININSYRNFILQNDLRKAIEKKQLELIYEPRINFNTGRVSSAEALLRWKHPNWGIIESSEIIDLANDVGLVVDIGKWAIQTIGQQFTLWQTEGIEAVPISLHYSVQQCLQKNLSESIQQLLEGAKISPAWIEFEISENVLLTNQEVISKSIAQLRTLGISITIADINLGYTTLQYLQRIEVDKLKINKSIVQAISESKYDMEPFLVAIVSFANERRISVIMEGIVTEKQLQSVAGFYGGELQGSYFSPPLIAAEFTELLVKNNSNKLTDFSEKLSHFKPEAIMMHTVKTTKVYEQHDFHQNKEILRLALERVKQQYSVSTREMDVFSLIVSGLSNKKISEQLFISEHTVKNHITSILHKLGVQDRLQAMAIVYQACLEEGKKSGFMENKSI